MHRRSCAVALTCALVGLSGGLGAGCGGDPSAKTPEKPALPRERAVAVATAAAVAEGYSREEYEVVQADRHKDGTWTVFFQHAPPAPPGGHCMVLVGADGATTVVRGR